MSEPMEKPMRERLARWIRTSAPAVVAGTAAPDEVLDALLDVMASAAADSLLYDAGRAELSTRSAAEAKAAFTAMLDAIKAGV